MNIFVTHSCPIESAKFLDDKRVVKMCLETAQMLCAALNEQGVITPYKTTHRNHPCNVWARASLSNWQWLLAHGIALCDEYTARYGKVHKCRAVLDEIAELAAGVLPNTGLTPFANCARNKEQGVDYTMCKDVHMAYQQYLNDRWDLDKREPTWGGVAA